jgi:hypothetical protein
MFTNRAATQLALVPSKNILVLFQNFPKLLLRFHIQTGIYSNSLTDFTPPSAHFVLAG